MPTITVTRTYLELREPAQLRPPQRRPDVAPEYVRHEPCPVPVLRRLYHDVGYDWHWHDLYKVSDDEVARVLNAPGVAVWEMLVGGECGGFFQLRRCDDGSVEIVYFGLTAPFIGRGYGGAMLEKAVNEGWGMGANRVWLHTCTLDSPHALPNYKARGFIEFGKDSYQTDIV